MEEYKVELTVNNEKISATAKPEESLLKFYAEMALQK